jgi:sarcosine oxidase, subunit gamma
MPDAQRRSVFEGCTLPKNSSVAVSACGFASRFVLRGGADIAAPVRREFGVAPPLAPLQASASGARAALWMSPDEWLLLDEACESDLGARLEAALAGVPHALIDVSHRHCALDVSGEGAERLLNAGVNLDLDFAAFPVGMVVRTLCLKADIVLWRRDEKRFRLETTRSFGPYLAAVLGQAASDQELC